MSETKQMELKTTSKIQKNTKIMKKICKKFPKYYQSNCHQNPENPSHQKKLKSSKKQLLIILNKN